MIVIFVYYIQSKTSILHQPAIMLTIIMTLAGLVNDILSLITFKNKETCQTGCRFYLLAISMIIFVLKFFYSYCCTNRIYYKSTIFIHSMSFDWFFSSKLVLIWIDGWVQLNEQFHLCRELILTNRKVFISCVPLILHFILFVLSSTLFR
jgi:hypothetical protein